MRGQDVPHCANANEWQILFAQEQEVRAAVRYFYQVPLIGWLARDAIEGLPDAKYFFAFNLVMLFAALVWTIGYPFVIVLALLATASSLAFLVALTGQDLVAELFASRRRR